MVNSSIGSPADRLSLVRRISTLRVFAMVCCALLGVAFWEIQVLEHERYLNIADSQNVKTIPLRAPRGVIFDREGRPLVENTYSFTIVVARDLSKKPGNNVDDTVRRFAAATGLDEAKTLEDVHRHIRAREPLYQPIVLIEHATLAQVAAVSARAVEMPEVIVQQEPARTYPAGGMAAHLFGYVGKLQESQVERPEFAGLPSGALVGQAGLERVYNDWLKGEDGTRDVSVNSKGREVRELGEEDAIDGARLRLTIDLDLERALEEAFKANDLTGAAIFMDPRNGEVLAMTSQPAYDPNDFASGLDHAEWARLNSDPKTPLTDRLIQNYYPPGSTFKILMTIAALSEGVITPDTQFTCYGHQFFYNRDYKCDLKTGHGTVNLRQAIEQSCNVYFFNVGNKLSIEQIHGWAEKLGLTGKTGIDLPGEIDSLVGSNEWKLKRFKEKWYPGDTISVAIGQGMVSLTPIGLARLMATVANGGTVVRPHLVKAVDHGDGWTSLEAPAPQAIVPISPDVLGPLKDGLWMVVNGAQGTASRARVLGHDVVGKTGTAQVISDEGKLRAKAAGTTANLGDNSWFVFYASKDAPEIAGVVFAEHAGHGGMSSAPVARYVLETYYAKKEGRPLPKLVTAADGTVSIVGGATIAPIK